MNEKMQLTAEFGRCFASVLNLCVTLPEDVQARSGRCDAQCEDGAEENGSDDGFRLHGGWSCAVLT